MAFNSQTFKTRTITSIVFVVVMLAGLLWNQWSFFILFSIIHFGCWVEYQKLIGLIDKDYQQITAFHKYGVMLAGWCIILYFTNDSYNIFGLRLHELGWWMGLLCIFVLPITELLFTRHIQLKNIGYSTLGLLYISLSWGLMMDIWNISFDVERNMRYIISPSWHHVVYPCLIIFSLWINDTMAYIVGSLMGKTSMSKISPRKTWEGTIGGVILCVAVMSIAGWLTELFEIHDVFFISAIAAIAGTFGDLLESKLKRMANVKDSGSLMPGHGGFLDRFDSLLLATPFVWLYIQVFIK
jgi:phosphatidate cytidylyltransferase